MLQNWLKPLAATFEKNVKTLPEWALGRQLQRYRTDLPNLAQTKIALIGVEETEANAIREQLYGMAAAFPADAIVDLGNLRKSEPTLLMQVLYDLLTGRVLPIVLGGRDDMAKAQFLAYQEAKALVNLAVVDQRLRAASPDEAYAGVFFPKRHPLLFHFGLVGYQIHQVPPQLLDFLQQNNFDHVRLGKSRAALEEAEPVLRDADLLAFHLSALRQSEAPGTGEASPSGYFTEEACQLCRYAGMSDKLTSFGLYGLHLAAEREGQTAQVAAQMLWYFLDGFFSRKGDYPVSTGGLTEYVVDFRKLNYQLTFWKSNRSGRWWMQVPVATKRKHERHRLVPCSYQDYQSACREELPERLLQAMNRF